MCVSRWAFARVVFLETRLMQFAFPLTLIPDPVAPFCLIQRQDKGLKDPEFSPAFTGRERERKNPVSALAEGKKAPNPGDQRSYRGGKRPSAIAVGSGGSTRSDGSVGNDTVLLPELPALLAELEEADGIRCFPGQGSRAPGRTLTLAAGCFPVAVFARHVGTSGTAASSAWAAV